MKYLFTGQILVLSALFFVGCTSDTANMNRNISNTANANRAVVVNNKSMPNNANSSNGNMVNASNANSVATVQDNFWADAAHGGMGEVELSKLASTKSKNAEVKKFAQMMVTDHTKVNAELKTLAATKKVVLPTEMDSAHKSIMDDLTKAEGTDFDKKYVDAMLSGHEDSVELFEDQSKDNSDAELKSFTTKTLPTLKAHLEMIKKMQESMKTK